MASNLIDIALDWRIHCSQIGKIMAKRDLDLVPRGTISFLKKELLAATIAPPLPKDNKYCLKGTRGQKAAADLIMEHVKKYPFLIESPGQRFDDFRIGEWDYTTPNDEIVMDIKCSYVAETFPKYETVCPNDDYDEWQVGAGYCPIIGAKKGAIAYVLLDATETEIEREVKRYCYIHDIEETEKIWDFFRTRMQYPKLTPLERIKIFEFDAQPDLARLVDRRVSRIRTEMIKLLNKYN